MQFETLFEFNEQEFQLKIFNDKSFVYIQIICIDKALLWGAVVDLNNLAEKFNFLEGCFFQPEDLAEYLIFQVSNGEFRLESGDEESRILNLIFWVQKEKEDEIEQYEFFFPLLLEAQMEIEKTEEENNVLQNKQNESRHNPLEKNCRFFNLFKNKLAISKTIVKFQVILIFYFPSEKFIKK